MKKRTLLTPIDLSDAQSDGKRTYWKQILPIGSIVYRGRKIDFTRSYLTDLANSFKEKAFDQVPAVFVDGENRHNMDPRNFGGEVVDMAVREDGLYGKVTVDKDTDKILRKNPRLGVSARIMEGLNKESDGRTFNRAIQHVALTMDPRVTGMKAWEAVDLSAADVHGQVVDLTALTIEKETAMPKIKTGGSRVKASKAKTTDPQPDKNGILDLSTLSDEALDIVLSAVTEAPAPKKSKKKVADPEVDDTDDTDDTDDEDTDEVADVDPDEVEDDDETDGDEDDEDDEDEPSPADLLAAEKERRAKAKKKDLSARRQSTKRIDLAGDALSGSRSEEFSQMRIDLAEERWQGKRKALVAAGVPPFLLDLAEPVLSSPDATVVDLSNSDDPVNVNDILLSVLDGVKGMIDLTPEIGHRFDLSEDESQASDDLLDEWNQQYG